MNEETQLIDLSFVNAYLVKAGAGAILIDTGVPQQWARLEAELLQAGVLPDQLKLVLITHGDYDHTGNCAELQQKYHAKIAMHPGDVEMVKTGQRAKRHGKGPLGKIFLWLGTRMGGNFHKFEPDIVLEDGQELTEFGLAARVIYTPGHTKGSIAVLTADGRLFAGDTVANWRKPGSAPFIENEKELKDSLLILKGTKARMVYPGHGKPFAFEALDSIHD
jgi:glyoxylase-like metal-dependent hydrolase (beta-lactamase superfamily II)